MGDLAYHIVWQTNHASFALKKEQFPAAVIVQPFSCLVNDPADSVWLAIGQNWRHSLWRTILFMISIWAF